MDTNKTTPEPANSGVKPKTDNTRNLYEKNTRSGVKCQAKPNYLKPLPEIIPQELKDRPQWVVWGAVWKDKEQKWSKVPFDAKTGRNAKSNDLATWSDFETAWKRYQDGGYDGIGFQLSKNDPYCGWDLDHCIDDGKIDPKFQKIIDRLNTYSEISPSGTGTRSFVIAKLPPDGRKKGPIETYESGRYLTLTGHHLPGTPTTIEKRQAENDNLHAEIFGKKKIIHKRGTPPKPTKPPLDDADLLSKAISDDRVTPLYNGDISGYNSQSEADQALCNYLAFYLQKNPTDIDTAFRSSGLMREKWDEKRGAFTYGQMTIQKAIDGTANVYDPAFKQNKSNPTSSGKKKKDVPDISFYKEIIDEMNKKHAGVMVGGKYCIMTEITDPIFKRHDIILSAVKSFKDSYANKRIPDPVKEDKYITKGNYWFTHADRREYQGIIFEPGGNVPGYYNLYQGLAVTPKQGKWDLYQQFIFDVIVNKNQDDFRWLLAWMARIVQDPGGKRPGTAVVVRGGKGTGKGVFCTHFGKLLGSHYLQLTQPSQITGQFNGHLKDCILAFCDEGFWAGDKTAESVLKAMITEPTRIMESKGKDAIQLKNHLNIIIASNESWVIPAGVKERRFFFLDVSDDHQQERPYFAAIEKEMISGGYEAMLHDLLRLDISGYDLGNARRTEGLVEQVIHGFDSVQSYWYERLQEGSLCQADDGWTCKVQSTVQVEEYKQHARDKGDRYPKSGQVFGRELNKLCMPAGNVREYDPNTGKRPVYKIYPDLETCRKEFEEVMNFKIDWENTD